MKIVSGGPSDHKNQKITLWDRGYSFSSTGPWTNSSNWELDFYLVSGLISLQNPKNFGTREPFRFSNARFFCPY